MQPMALSGVRVLDFTKWWAGPMAARTLGDYGAEVIKVESTVYLDPWRGGTKPAATLHYPGGKLGERPWNRSPLFNTQNRNKLDVTVDMAQPLGRELMKRLVALSDIVIENFSAGVMERLGLGYEVLREAKPDVIMISMPGFGLTGPERDNIVFGLTMEWLAGVTQLTGHEGGPAMPMTGLAYGDPIGALNAALAALAALKHRRRTGEGLYIDLASVEALTLVTAESLMDYALNGRVQPRIGNHHPSMAPHRLYRCAGEDDWVAITVGNDDQWGALCAAIGQPDLAGDARFATLPDRLRNQKVLDALIAEWTAAKGQREVMAILQRAGVPAGPVFSAKGLSEDPHLEARGFFEKIDHPEAGTHRYPGMIAKLEGTPGRARTPAPCLAEHNDFVFRELLGLTEDEIEELHAKGVTGTEPAM